MKKIKKMFKWIWDHIHSLLLLIGSGIVLLFVAKDYLNKREIKKRNWKAIPGNKTEVMLRNKNGEWERIKLPVVNNKQIKVDDIEHIGQTERGGEYAISYKHKPKNRRDIISTDDNNSMDI